MVWVVRNGNVVRGEKPRFRVKCWWREVWSREPNCGFGSSPASPECGPRREIMVFGQALVAGSVVQGEKPRFRVKRWWREVWSREQNCGPGQALVAGSMVQGAKLRVWVKPVPARVWSEERNYGLWSSADGGKYGLGSKTVPPSHPRPCPGMVQGEKLRPRSTPSPPECGPRREIMVFGQALVAGSVVQGAKLRPGSSQTPP